jgi:RNA ligase (TIGR02306 family)
MLNPKTNQRELAYITTIQEIRDLPGYDKVEYARVINWWCVVRKGTYKVGDLCVYFEIDSKVPAENPVFDFMSKYKYRIKTQKLCKVLSQGLIMTLEELGLKDVKEGEFLTKKLGVTYYEAEDNVRKANNKELIAMKVAKRMEVWGKKHKFLSRSKFFCNLRKKLFEKQIKKEPKRKRKPTGRVG